MNRQNSTLRIVLFNCKNVKTSAASISELCNTNDIILLQETWLCKQDLIFLNTIHCDFYSKGTYNIDLGQGPIRGRPYGGLAILWRKSLANISQVSVIDSRIMSINILNGKGDDVLIYNVYLPYQCADNYNVYMDYVGKPMYLFQSSSTPCV